MLVDANGQKEKLTGDWAGEDGLAWAPGGNEIWFTATKSGEAQALYAVTLSRQTKGCSAGANNLRLQDISREGQVLLDREISRRRLPAWFPMKPKSVISPG